jgi:hypothetical protein
MIAVALLVGVLLAVSKIFSTTSQVTGIGSATADVLQEAAAIERQIRADFRKLSYDGVFAIRCVAVPNDIHYTVDRPLLLNPNLDRDAILRCDQLLFFTNGAQAVQTYQIGQYSNKKGQGTATRIYYGHAFQIGDLGESFDGSAYTAHDPLDRVYPWTDSSFPTDGPINMVRTEFQGGNLFNWSSAGQIDLPPRDARTWLLARQPVVLVDDDATLPSDQSKTDYLQQVLSAYSIFLWEPLLGNNFQIFQGRVDAAATQLNDIRRTILNVDLSGDPYSNPEYGKPQPWMNPSVADDQRDLIADQLLYYPRAERYPPSMHRVDQALSNHVLGTACSSIAIDWTWEERTGEIRDALGNVLWTGLGFDNSDLPDLPAGSQTREQPWFGMPGPQALLGGDILPDYRRGVGAYGDPEYQNLDDGTSTDNYFWAETIPIIDPPNVEGHLNNIERVYNPLPGVVVYEAIFGYNQDRPLQTDPSDPNFGNPDLDMGYTPWPSAVRITLTLHDPEGRLENGREIQFVVNLPRKAIDMPEP